MIKKMLLKKTLAFALISAGSFAAAPAFSQAMSDWEATCVQHQTARQAENAYNFSQAAQNDDYLRSVGEKEVKGPNPQQMAAGTSPGNFNCSAVLKGTFDSFLKSTGSIFGIDLGSLFGNSSGNVCSSVNKAIGQTVGGMNLQCPRVENIPGFTSACSSAARSATSAAKAANNTYTGPSTATPTYQNTTTTSSSSSVGSSVSCWFTGNC